VRQTAVKSIGRTKAGVLGAPFPQKRNMFTFRVCAIEEPAARADQLGNSVLKGQCNGCFQWPTAHSGRRVPWDLTIYQEWLHGGQVSTVGHVKVVPGSRESGEWRP
jgi:hypothetical protein